MGTLLWVYSL